MSAPAPTFLRQRTISPFIELGAYEAMWDRDGAWFANIAARFAGRPGTVPSDFVDEDEARRYAGVALAMLAEAGIASFGVRVHGAGEYPDALRDAEHPIELLYFQGWWDLVSTPCVSVVGSRGASADGLARARKLARALVADGYTVVSGLAAGIDTAAHVAAVEANGRTIAVIGTPLSHSYPPQNRALQAGIAKDFLVISQVPVVRYSKQTPHVNRLFFPARNITMSALTRATIIVEAGETSGSLIQARAAIAQKRKLFILENCFARGLKWPDKYVAKGAIRVRGYDEIRHHLGASVPELPR